MSTTEVPLAHPVTLGETVYTKAVLREVDTAMILAAQEESEKLMPVPDDQGKLQPEFVSSPALFGLNIFRRQIIKLISETGGHYDGPLERSEIERLHPVDFNHLQKQAEIMDGTIATDASRAVTQRGRTEEDDAEA